MIYGAAQPTQIRDAIGWLSIADVHPDIWAKLIPVVILIPCVLLVGTIVLAFITRKLYDEFAWSIYKHISADLRMKRRYLTYQVCSHLGFGLILT
jgi:hypothetical protein